MQRVQVDGLSAQQVDALQLADQRGQLSGMVSGSVMVWHEGITAPVAHWQVESYRRQLRQRGDLGGDWEALADVEARLLPLALAYVAPEPEGELEGWGDDEQRPDED
jgi:hypothetical protein